MNVPPDILLNVYAIVARLLIILPLLSGGILVSFVTCEKGIQSSWIDFFIIVNSCPGKSYPCLLFFSFCDEEVLDELSSIISDRISGVAIFPLNSAEEERIKYR